MNEVYSVSSETLIRLSGVFFALFAFIGAFDGIYFHLIKYKLHLSPSSRLEHQIHTLRAFLFIPIVYFLFAQNSVGLGLWVGILFTVIDLGVEVVDILVEKESRKNLGGISSVESVVHVAATSCRVAAILLILLSKNPNEYALGAMGSGAALYPVALRFFSYAFIVGTFWGGLHQLGGLIPSTYVRYQSALRSTPA